MKTYWRNTIFCTGLLLAITTSVQGETGDRIATALPPTDAPPNELVTENSRSTEYQTAYQKGKREAEENIAQGKPSIYTVGLWHPNSAAVDQQTGFPVVSIGGCIVDDSILGRMNGYNERIRQWATEQRQVGSSKSASDSQDNSPQKPAELSSGIEGRSTSTSMPGAIQIGVDKVTPRVSPSRVTISVFDGAGRKVSKIQPDASGYFRVPLKPGTYTLHPDLPKPTHNGPMFETNQIVTVEAERFTPVTVNYTTLFP